MALSMNSTRRRAGHAGHVGDDRYLADDDAVVDRGPGRAAVGRLEHPGGRAGE